MTKPYCASFVGVLLLALAAPRLAAQLPQCVLANTRATIAVNQSRTDSLTGAGCKLKGTYMEAAVYRLTLPAPRAVRIYLTGRVVAEFRLFNEDEQLIDFDMRDVVAMDNGVDGAAGSIAQDLPAGTYYIAVTSFAGAKFGLVVAGAQATAIPRLTCGSSVEIALAVGESRRGVLPASGGCTYLGGPATTYRLSVDSPQNLLITLTTPEDDSARTRVMLRDADGRALALGYDGFGSKPARIERRFTPGVYHLVVFADTATQYVLATRTAADAERASGSSGVESATPTGAQLLYTGNIAYKAAVQSNRPEDFEAALTLLSRADAADPTPEAKLLVAVSALKLAQHWATQLQQSQSCADANKARQYLGLVDAKLPGATTKFAEQASKLADGAAQFRTYIDAVEKRCK